MVKSEKNEYLAAELDILNLISTDVITTSAQGGADNDNGDENRDDSGWT